MPKGVYDRPKLWCKNHPSAEAIAKGLCSACYQRERYKTRKPSKEYAKNHNLKHYYGMTVKAYTEMLLRQNGVCAICQRPETRANQFGLVALSVDHDHVTGAVRELLCSRCNTALGYLDDNASRAAQAAAYLLRHRTMDAVA
jgi:hypothetical protein